MIPHTKAYKTLKNQQQSIIDYAILTNQSISELNKNITFAENRAMWNCKGETGLIKLSKAKHFNKPFPLERMKNLSKSQNKNLSKFLLISLFSFFEGYVKNALKELIEFHGGEEKYKKYITNKIKTGIINNESNPRGIVNALKEEYEPHRKLRYIRNIEILETNNYTFPSAIFSLFGFETFLKKLKKLKAVEILEILEKFLFLDIDNIKINNIDENIKKYYNCIRQQRNDNAHGNEIDLCLKKVLKYNDFLKQFSKIIDQHITKNFLIIETKNKI